MRLEIDETIGISIDLKEIRRKTTRNLGRIVQQSESITLRKGEAV